MSNVRHVIRFTRQSNEHMRLAFLRFLLAPQLRIEAILNLVNEYEMADILKITQAQFNDYVSAGVFSPIIHSKRGRTGKNPNKGSLYDSITVQSEFKAFQEGAFVPVATVPKQDIPPEYQEPAKPAESGEVIRFKYDQKPEKKTREIREVTVKEKEFDYKTIIGDISTFKLLEKKIIEIAPRPDVPTNIKRSLQATYELLLKKRHNRAIRKQKIPIEKYQADCQKVFDSCMLGWNGAYGLEAADKIVEKIEEQIGKSLRREFSNIVPLVHRAIVEVNNNQIKPYVAKLLEAI
jgi:hypothetical protein